MRTRERKERKRKRRGRNGEVTVIREGKERIPSQVIGREEGQD
jgi:hypothetical protein